VGDGKREGDGLMGFRHACSLLIPPLSIWKLSRCLPN
jgi:hypothetical protein